MKNKIILGSANFDQTYGISKNFIDKIEIKKLLDLASRNKIKVIDTSPTYGKSEKIIGTLNKNRFKVISKISIKIKNRKKNINSWVKKSVKDSLHNLKIKNLECSLLQNANSLLGKDGDRIYKSLKNVKKIGLTNKIGISIYDFDILDKILKKFKFDLVQAPFNIVDQRLFKTGWLNILKKKKIEVHARSTFLQGILLLKYNQIPKKLKKFNKSWKIWENWLKKNKLNSLQACLSFVFNQHALDGVVIAHNSKKDLKKNLEIIRKNKSVFTISDLKIKQSKFIDPRKW